MKKIFRHLGKSVIDCFSVKILPVNNEYSLPLQPLKIKVYVTKMRYCRTFLCRKDNVV